MNPEPIRVLHLEDSHDYAKLVRSFLTKEGMVTEITPTLAGALESIRRRPPDVVLMDLHVLDATGSEILEAVARVLPQGIPILPLTSSENEEKALGLLSLGAQDYLQKEQITQQALARVIRYSLERKKHEVELADLREKLARGEKMGTLGTLVAGLAHELNNPLAVVQGYTEMLLQGETLPGQKDKLETVLEESRRCADLIRQLLEFSRGREMRKEEMDLHSLLERLIHLLHDRIASQEVRVVTRFHAGDIRLLADPHQMLEVFTRIFDNALKVLRSEPAAVITLTTFIKGAVACVSIEDNGEGIDPEKLGRVFDPFFSTRDVGKGLGLGLPLAYGIVSRHGGTIRAENAQPHGARILVELPLNPAP